MSEFTGRLKVVSENNEGSKKSLRLFKKIGSDGEGYEYIHSSGHSYLNNKLIMKNFFPSPPTMEQINEVSRIEEYERYIDTWNDEYYGGHPDRIFDCEITDETIHDNEMVSYSFLLDGGKITRFLENISVLFPTLTFHHNYFDEDHFPDEEVVIKNGNTKWEKKIGFQIIKVTDQEEFEKFQGFLDSHKDQILKIKPDIIETMNSNLELVWKDSERQYWDEIVFSCSYDYVNDICLDDGFGFDFSIDRHFRNLYQTPQINLR